MIVGLSGYGRSGKDEAAKGLAQLGFKRVAFADKVREFLLTLNPIIGSRSLNMAAAYKTLIPGTGVIRVKDVIDQWGWDGYKNTDYSQEIRELLQRLGTECGRGLISENIWVDGTFRQMNAPHEQHYVITDVRFPNEAKAIKDRGGIIIRINRTGVGPANDHHSETALDSYTGFNAVIFNDGSINGLHESIRSTVAGFLVA